MSKSTGQMLSDLDPRSKPSFTLGNRIRRATWNLVYALLFRPSPRPLHAWRSGLLKLFGAKVGAGCHVYSKVDIWAPWNLVLGDEVGVADGATLYSMAQISLGSRCVISQGAHLCTGSHDYTDPLFALYAKPITVGPETWICAEAFVGPGVEIGEGAVIGARSVVLRNMPAWTVCGGYPCVPIKPRVMKGGDKR